MQTSLFVDPQESADTLDGLSDEILRRAANLPHFKQRSFIFGDGAPACRVAIVGESPGPPDISSGKPFMGPVGQMLERMLESIGLKRSDCYLTNVVKIVCNADEIVPDWLKFFIPYLHRELLAVRPRLIVVFGNHATRALLDSKKSISQLRGQFYDYHGIQLIPTFNPAYLLRDPLKKREVWEDLKKVRLFLTSA
jgi:uracil-DNA glycosylase